MSTGFLTTFRRTIPSSQLPLQSYQIQTSCCRSEKSAFFGGDSTHSNLIGHLAEDKDIVGSAAPDAGNNEDKEEGGVDEAEVEEDGGGKEPEEGVDELTHHKDDFRLHLVWVVNLTRRQHPQPGI